MPRFRHPIVSLTATSVLLLSSSSAWSLQSPPPIIEVGVPNSRVLIQWEPGDIRCDGKVVTAERSRRPWNQLGWVADKAPRTLTLGFAIDPTGRPVSITRQTKDYVPASDDVAPAFAASRFAAQAPQRDCSVIYRMRAVPVAQADIPELISYSVHPLSGPLPEEGWARIRSVGGNCLQDPRSEPLLRAYPDYAAIPATPGAPEWAMVRYDLDAAGKVRAPAILIGTGNRALEAAAVKAMRHARFTRGARTGCLNPYWRVAAKLPAPAMPEAIRTTKIEGGNCPDEHGWAVAPQLRFPEAYRRRSIEGWALVSYDVAPWGETGNLKVLASEPSDDFGAQALSMIRAARLPASKQGFTGCVDRVRFNMGPQRSPGVGGEGGVPVPVPPA